MPSYNVRYPGLPKITRATYTASHGDTPGTCLIECPPQTSTPEAHGTVELLSSEGSIVLRNCRLKSPQQRADPLSGQVLTLQLLDRRWLWAFGAAYGEYNLRQNDGTIQPGTERTPKQLASLLFTAAGETGWSVDEMPTDILPEVRWTGEPPMRALSSLADQVGCRLVFDPVSDTASVRRLGFGNPLPSGASVMAESVSIEFPSRPDSIRAQLGETTVEATLILEAVGLDVDGQWVPIDQLSYKPASGWAQQDPGHFLGVPHTALARAGVLATVSARDLAIETVWRTYRVSKLLGNNSVRSLNRALGREFNFRFASWRQLLPIRDELATIDDTTGRPGRAFVQGVFDDGHGRWVNTPAWSWYPHPFRLVGDIGLVQFDLPVYKWSATTKQARRAPADLYLTTTFSVRHHETWAPHRYAIDLVLGGPRYGTGPAVVQAEELAYKVAMKYSIDGEVNRVETNQAEVDADGKIVCVAAARQYQTTAPQNYQYAGIMPVRLDGLVQQVSWTIDCGVGAMTQASLNDEFKTTVPSYKERRMLAGLAQVQTQTASRQVVEAINRRRREMR